MLLRAVEHFAFALDNRRQVAELGSPRILIEPQQIGQHCSGFVACALFSGKRSHSKTPTLDHSRRQRGKEETE